MAYKRVKITESQYAATFAQGNTAEPALCELRVAEKLSLTWPGKLFTNTLQQIVHNPVRKAGVDVDGKQAFEDMTPAEIVDRASEITRKALDEIQAYGWCIDIPTDAEIAAALSASEARAADGDG